MVREPRQPVFRRVDCRHLRASSRELRGLAARRRAEVGHAESRDVSEQTRRQAGGRVLHPPGAFVIAGKLSDIGGETFDTHGACRQHDAAELLRPFRPGPS